MAESSINKVNVGPALNVPLALASRGTRLAGEQFEKYGVVSKVSAMKEHPVAVKVMTSIDTFYEFIMLGMGLVLLFHGAQFKNLFLCYQIVTTFCLDRVKESVLGIHTHVMSVQEKLNADAPAETSSPDAKAEAKPDNKHAQKRNSKKDDAKDVDLKAQQEQDMATTKKYLKAIDTDKVARAAFDLFTTFMACHMVMRSSAMQAIMITHALVKAAKKYTETFFEFTGHEDMLQWMDLLMSFVFYVGFGFLSVTMSSVAMALNFGVVAAHLVSNHALRVAEVKGKLESAEVFSASMKGLLLSGGLTAFGTMWQFWALMAGSGLAWYFQVLYLPVVTAEFFIGLL